MFACMGYVNGDIWISNSSRPDWAHTETSEISLARLPKCEGNFRSTLERRTTRYHNIDWAHLSVNLSTDIWQYG